MPDTTITKIDSTHSPKGAEGQKYLACGKSMSMRLWENESADKQKEETKHDYETVGFCIKGKAELHLEGQMVLLNPGDSWVVPKGASHRYKILEAFSAVETTSPPAELHDRAASEKGFSPKEFAEATARDAATVKSPEPVNKDSAAQQAKAGTEDAKDAQGEMKGSSKTADTDTPNKAEAEKAKPANPDQKDGAEGKEAGKKDDAAVKDKPEDGKCEGGQKEECDAEKIQKAAAELPRTDSKVTSNADEKKPEPSEKTDVAAALKAEAEEKSEEKQKEDPADRK